MHCLGCGTEAAEGSRFCIACGTPLPDPAALTVVAPQGERELLLRALRRELARDYRLEAELGSGGMAIVYKATEVELRRTVALKVLPPKLALSQSAADRFKREARMAASLDHPNIIPVYRVGHAGSIFYIAMKFIEGRALDAIVDTQGALPVPVVLHILRAASGALAFAHEHGIVHRDIKGGNILIDKDGRVVVSDFGIARAMADASLTISGSVMGTPYFMSPEQCSGRPVGPQSDQYSLGVVAFQMLAGVVPFSGETLPAIMHHHFYTPVPDLGAVRPDAPPGLVEVITRSLAKDPSQRFASTADMLAALEAVPFTSEARREAERMLRDLAQGVQIDRSGLGAVPPADQTVLMTTPVSLRRRRARPRAAMAAVAAATLAVLGVGTWWTARVAPDGRATNPAATRASTVFLDAAPHAGRDSAAVDSGPVTGYSNLTSSGLAAVPVAASRSAGTAELARDNRSRPEATRASRSGELAAFTAESSSSSAPPPVRSAGEAAGTAARSRAADPTGRVRVRAYPADAEIEVDGRRLGRGVVVDSVLPAGTRNLRVSAPGYFAFDSTFTVRAGETTQLPRIALRAQDP